ncbi:hypothetical protein [Pseudomonas syringae]|nr:hypothetical protein [Pseudomonas syringae]
MNSYTHLLVILIDHLLASDRRCQCRNALLTVYQHRLAFGL